ncbi:MAG: hypothetical protein JWR80_4814 [Bradyrhizobium sp.]|nr:hypothetical protein [Bradyrhizobium sp.]
MSEKSEIPSESMSSYLLNEASNLLRQVAGDRRADESKKAMLRRVGRDVKDWTASRVKDVWYRDPRVRIRANEVEYLRALVCQRQEKKADVDELDALRTRITRLEYLLEATAPPLDRPGMPAPGQQFGEVGGGSGVVD